MKIWIGAVVSLAIGFALGVFWGSRNPVSRSSPAEAPAQQVSRPAPEEKGVAPEEASTPTGARGAPPEKRSSVSSNEDALLQALRNIPAPAVEVGDGAIRGRVTLSNGEPFPGVKVTASPMERQDLEDREEDQTSGWAAVEAQTRELVRRYRWGETGKREAITGEDGRYEITGLAEYFYEVDAARSGYRMEDAKMLSDRRARPGITRDFLAVALVKLPVEVLLPDGTAPRRATVRHFLEDGNDRVATKVAWLSSQPQIEIEPGIYSISASSWPDGSLRSTSVRVALSTGQTPESIALRLEPRPGIRGRVLLPEGEEVGLIFVHLASLPPGVTPSLSLFKLDKSSQTAYADPANNFQFKLDDLEPGQYLVGVTRSEMRDLIFDVVTLTDQNVTHDLTLPPLDRIQFLAVRAYGPDGNPLRKAEFFGLSEVRGKSSNWVPHAVPRSDGSFWVRARDGKLEDGLSEEEERSASYWLSVESVLYGRRKVPYRPGQSEELVVHFSEPAMVHVAVSGLEGSGLEGMLGARVLEPGGFRKYSFRNDQDGRGLDRAGQAQLGPIEPGACDVVLEHEERGLQRNELQRVRLEAKSGMNEVTIALPQLHELKVLFEAPSPGLGVSIERPRGWLSFGKGGSRKIQVDGSVVFGRLAPGEYRVTAFGGGSFKIMQVRVPERREVRFEPLGINAYKVTIDDPQGGFGRAGLEAGDLVIGFNGAAFEDLSQMCRVLVAASVDKEIRFTVLRGDRKFEVTLETHVLLNPAKSGGILEPAVR